MPDPYSTRENTKTVSNPDLSKLHDRTSPTLTSLMLMETMKWGSILVVLFVIFSFTEPIWSPIVDYFTADPQTEQQP